MKRRRLFTALTGAVVGTLTAGAWFVVRERSASLSFSALPESMKALHDASFADAYPSTSLEDLLDKLEQRNVYGQRKFHVSQIRSNATSDSLIEFDGFLYTESELLLYAIIARWQAAGAINFE